MKRHFYLFTDGASRGNPGPAGAGAVIKNQEGEVLLEKSQFLGRATNNEAEYRALILGLESAKELEPEKLTCLSDSQLVVSQLIGKYRVKKEHLRKLLVKVRRVEKFCPDVIYKHIPREKNKMADKLANEALNARS
jgi:ribonuclease HI